MVATFGRWIHIGAAWLFAAGVLLQAFLAGQAMPQIGGTASFEAHISFGYSVMGLLALAVLVGALVGRVGRRQVGLSIGLLFLYIVQTVLPNMRTSSPVIAALHPANAMLLLVLAIYIAVKARRLAADRATQGN
jgi:ABC-type Na+ efflux pump permease subunit